MQLLSNADIGRPEEELAPLIAQAQNLAELWIEFVKQDGEHHQYTVIDHGEKNRAPGIHASEMKCERKVYYSILGTERKVIAESVDVNLKMRMRLGTAIHSMLQSDFKRMAEWFSRNNAQHGLAMTFEAELSINRDLQALALEWGLSSSCDGAFTFWYWSGSQWVPYLRVGLEIKSSSDGQYTTRKRPDFDHMEQTCLYQACLDLPLMWVLYYNKNNSNFTTPYAPWLFKFDRDKWTRDLEVRFAKAHQNAAARSTPDRAEGKHCAWCPFAWECKPKVLNRPAFNATPVIPAGMRVGRP